MPQDSFELTASTVRKLAHDHQRLKTQVQNLQARQTVRDRDIGQEPLLIGKAAETIASKGVGSFTVWQRGSGTDVATTEVIQAFDWLGTGIVSGESAYLIPHWESGIWAFISHGVPVIEVLMSTTQLINVSAPTPETLLFDDDSELNEGGVFVLSKTGPTEGEITINKPGVIYTTWQCFGEPASDPGNNNVSFTSDNYLELDTGSGFVAEKGTHSELSWVHLAIGAAQHQQDQSSFGYKRLRVASGDVIRIVAEMGFSLQSFNYVGDDGGTTQRQCHWGVHFISL